MYEEFVPSLNSAIDLDGYMDDVEIELSMLDTDLDLVELDGFGVIATKGNYNRLLKKVKRLKASLSGASRWKTRRLQRRLKWARRKLQRMRKKLGRQVARRGKLGMKTSRRHTRLKGAMKTGRTAKRSARVSKAFYTAKTRGWPSDLSPSSSWLEGTKVKDITYFYRAVFATYSRAISYVKAGSTWSIAIRRALTQIKRKDYRTAVYNFFRAHPEVASAASASIASGGAAPVLRRGPRQLRRRRGFGQRRAGLMALRQRRLKLLTEQQAQTSATSNEDAVLQQQQQAAASAAAAASIARQRAMLQNQLAQQRAAYAQQIRQVQTQEASARSVAPMPDEESFEAEGMDEGGTDEGMDEGMDGEETPIYKKPIFLIAALGIGAFAYMQTQKKKKGKTKPKAKA